MKVLLVDDDQGTRLTLRFVLSQGGHQVYTASDGEEAIKLLRANPFDWLVTDADMSPVNGFELAGQARTLQPQIRIVMISGVFDSRDIAGLPISKLFSKPIDTEALLSHLNSFKTGSA